MLRRFFQGTLGYVGLAVHRPFVAYHVPYIDDAARKAILAELEHSVLTLEGRPLLPMPDLRAYDETLRPIRSS
jgi:NAD(P)H dehydrogenase (quinone)